MDQVKFLNASVTDVACQIGWNEQSSSLNVGLVEDDGDLFLPAQDNLAYIGKPYYFTFGSFNYGGILQNWTRDYSTGGLVYRVSLNDPRAILDGVHVVMNGFQLDGNLDQVILKGEMPNLFNVFDYWETSPYGSFGGSNINEAGMQYEYVKAGILGIIQNYGPIRYRGVDYYIDFAELPTPPIYYRLGAESASLIEIISQLCQDSGADFFCNLELRGDFNYITFKSVYRTTQPPLGQIKVYTDRREGLPDNDKVVTSTSRGVELRNDTVSVLLVGGAREDMHFVDNSYDFVRPFWGFSSEGYAYTSTNYEDLTDVTVNCEQLSLVTGGATTYTTKVIEFKAALFNFDTWAIAVAKYNPNVAKFLGLKSFMDIAGNIKKIVDQGGKPIHKANTKKDSVRFQSYMASGGGPTSLQVVQAVYEFVRQVAEEYYGKQFLVKLDQVQTKFVPDSGEIISSSEVGDSGYMPPGSELTIGLNGFNNDIFQDDSGKYTPFARFDSVQEADLSNMNPLDVAFQDDGATVFTKVQVESMLIQNNKNDFLSTACVIKLSNPIVKASQYTVGDPVAMMNLTGLNQEDIDKYKRVDAKNFGIKMPVAIIPVAAIPSKVAIPLKSNKLSYGPWRTRAFSEGGKVRFEKDESLVPWNFGGYIGLDYAAEAKVANAYTGMIASELGSVEEAGAPTKSIGDLIKAGGPNVTSINIGYGTDGIKTTYQMQTYTPKFGAFSLQNAERLKKINLNAIKVRRIFKQNLRKQLISRTIPPYMNNTFGGAKRFGGTPHEGLVAYVDDGKDDDGNPIKFTTVSSDISQHFSAKFGGNIHSGDMDEEFKKMGAVGFEGIFRPYLINPEANDQYIPKFVTPTQSGVPNVTTLNPFQDGHDVDIVLKGKDEYEDYVLKGSERGSPNDLRPIGLKSPLVMVGWGYDINGNPVPADPNDSKKFQDNYLTSPEKWKAGPVDLRWDAARGVWSGGSSIQLVKLNGGLFANENKSTVVDAEILTHKGIVDVNSTWISFDPSHVDKIGSTIKVFSMFRQVNIGSGTRCWVTPFGHNLYGIISTE